MLEMRAVVTKVVGEEVMVMVAGSGCGHCSSEGGCGSNALSRLFCSSKPRQFSVHNQAGARVGDEVRVTLPDGILLRSALRMYAMPLMLLLAGGIAGASFADGATSRDIFAVAGALAGLLLGFILARSTLSRIDHAVATTILSQHS